MIGIPYRKYFWLGEGCKMGNYEIIKEFLGEVITEEDLKSTDFYIHPKIALMIPNLEVCKYIKNPMHTHPSYQFVIAFSKEIESKFGTIVVKENQYWGTLISPDIPHNDFLLPHHYSIYVEKNYFEEQYKMYAKELPEFEWKEFAICHDILHALNMFVFEYSKNMQNAEITLDAQATILVHWLIRSVLGETYDMRSVSNNYAVARAEQYIEIHYQEKITVKFLAELGNLSISSFNRIFKKETKMTPMDYLMQIRLEQSKKILKRKEIPITEVAIRCGFNSSAHFSTSFRKCYKITPKEYRAQYH